MTPRFSKGERVRAFALFGLPPVSGEVVADSDGSGEIVLRVTHGEYQGRIVEVGPGQIVGTPEYREKVSG